MVSIRKFRIFVLVSNRIEYWSNYSIRFEILNIRTSLIFAFHRLSDSVSFRLICFCLGNNSRRRLIILLWLNLHRASYDMFSHTIVNAVFKYIVITTLRCESGPDVGLHGTGLFSIFIVLNCSKHSTTLLFWSMLHLCIMHAVMGVFFIVTG